MNALFLSESVFTPSLYFKGLIFHPFSHLYFSSPTPVKQPPMISYFKEPPKNSLNSPLFTAILIELMLWGTSHMSSGVRGRSQRLDSGVFHETGRGIGEISLPFMASQRAGFQTCAVAHVF